MKPGDKKLLLDMDEQLQRNFIYYRGSSCRDCGLSWQECNPLLKMINEVNYDIINHSTLSSKGHLYKIAANLKEAKRLEELAAEYREEALSLTEMLHYKL